MVKIKAGYVMNPKETAEYERVNALPRKSGGRVDYYFKPQTKYPPRIYVFMDAELWRDRNRRPMGLHTAFPFLSRPMNQQEIEYHHFNWRLCYYQYEDWDKLLCAEEQEAAELEKENPGTGREFLDRLNSCREKFPLAAKEGKRPPVPPELPVSGEMRYFRELMEMGDTLTATEISGLLDAEQQGEKRPLILTLLREYYKNIVLPEAGRTQPDEEKIAAKVAMAAERRRKHFVRRVCRRNRLFALAEIQQTYPGYTEAMLLADLKMRPQKPKRKKHKPITDLRRCQLAKLVNKLKYDSLDEKSYNATCNRIVMLQQAHEKRLPIPLTVKIGGEVLVYSFGWKTRENVVKSFADLANTKGITHAQLQERYQEMVASTYSY